MKNVKAMVMVFAVALMMIGVVGTAQASMYYNGDENFPSVYSDGYGTTYYIDRSSACYGTYDNSGDTEFAAIFIEENARGGSARTTYQFKDASDASYWSTTSSSSWHRISNKVMWMFHNAAKNYAQ